MSTATLFPNRFQPIAYYDARFPNGYGVGAPTTGAAIGQWNDLSGNARHLTQATTTRRPLYQAVHAPAGSRPAIQFDGTDDGMVLAGASLPQSTAVTVYVVAQNNVKSTSFSALLGRANQNGTHVDPFWRWSMGVSSANKLDFRRDVSVGQPTATMTSTEGLTRKVVTFKTQTGLGYLNGVQVVDMADGTLSYPSGATDFMVGMTTTGIEPWSGSIERIAIYDGTHSDEQRLAIEAYFMNPDDTMDPYGAIVAADAPVAWYRFDGGFSVDAVDGGIAGTRSGSPASARSLLGDASLNEALDFDGVNDAVVIANQTKTQMIDNFTLEAWVTADTYPLGGFPSGTLYLIEKMGSTSAYSYGFSIWDGDITWFVQQGATTGYTNAFGGSLNDMIPGKTFHVAGTYRGGEMKLFVNGYCVAVNNAVGTFTTMSGAMSIGCRGGVAAAPYFDGRMDEVALYNRVLTDDEILEHYRVGRDNVSPSRIDDPLSNSILRDDPIGWLHAFNGTLNDFVAEGASTGTLTNGATIASPSIIPTNSTSQAIVLDGVNDYVVLPASNKWETSLDQSIEVWVTPTVITGPRCIAHKDGDYTLRMDATGRVSFSIVTADGATSTNTATNPLVAGQTYHIVATYREDGFWNSALYLYINGVLAAPRTDATNGSRTVDNSPLYVGSVLGTSEFWSGKIANLAVYDTPLGPGRANERYQLGLGTYSPPVRPFNGDFAGELVAGQWPPEWEPYRGNKRGDSSYLVTWDAKGRIANSAPGPYSTGFQLFKHSSIPAQTDWDITYQVYPPAIEANKEMNVYAAVCHDGVYHADNPWTARNGYVLWMRISLAGVFTSQIARCANFVETLATSAATIPSTTWPAMKVRMQRRASVIRYKIWPDGQPEPVSWTQTYTDPSPLAAGWPGVGYTNAADTTSRGADFDNIRIYGGPGMRHFRVSGGVEVPLDMSMIRSGAEVPVTTEVP